MTELEDTISAITTRKAAMVVAMLSAGMARILLESVPGEQRNDAAGDDDQDHDDEIHRHQIAAQKRLRQEPGCAQVMVDVAQPKQRQQGQKLVVPSALAEHERNRQDHRQYRQEAQLRHPGDGRRHAADTDETADGPEPDQHRQQHALRRRSLCPVLDGRQQKARQNGAGETEDHLVAVPSDALEPRLTRQRCVVVECPPRDEPGAQETAE